VCARGSVTTDAHAMAVGVANLELYESVKHPFWSAEKFRFLLNRAGDVEHCCSGDP
jgi:hypothetical protein